MPENNAKQKGQKFTSSSDKRKKTPRSGNETGTAISRIRRIGNSKGILLSNGILKKSGLKENGEVVVSSEIDCITIKPLKTSKRINTDLSTWEAQFKAAIRDGDKPEADLFDGMLNDFDKSEWK